MRCGNKTLDLTATEYRLLQFLAAHPGFVYSRASIIDGALGRDITVLERTIDVHIMSLRRKLGRCGGLDRNHPRLRLQVPRSPTAQDMIATISVIVTENSRKSCN